MKKDNSELIAFVERFAKGRWTLEADGTVNVIGNLYCYNNELTSLPENLKVSGDLSCYNNELTSLPENLKVSGNLYCSHNKLTSLPENLKVSGDLNCYNNKLTSLPENLKVGGRLNCSYNKLTSLPENLKVGGDLYCYNNKAELSDYRPKRFAEFEVGDDYVYADGILSEVESVKRRNGLTIYNCVFGFVVSDGEYHSHGKTLRQAITDLNFKKSDRNADEYEGLDVTVPRSVEELTVMYRVITGACSFGCEQFISGKVKKTKLTIRDAIKLTADQYGGKQFASFFAEGEMTDETKDRDAMRVI